MKQYLIYYLLVVLAYYALIIIYDLFFTGKATKKSKGSTTNKYLIPSFSGSIDKSFEVSNTVVENIDDESDDVVDLLVTDIPALIINEGDIII